MNQLLIEIEFKNVQSRENKLEDMSIYNNPNRSPESISRTNQQNAEQEQPRPYISSALSALSAIPASISSPHSISHQIDPAQQLQLELRNWVGASPDQTENRGRRIAAQRILTCYAQNLSILNLQGLRLSSLPESIGNLSELKSLHLSRTSIASLPASIGRLSKLKSLIRNNTPIASLPASIGHLSKLETLYLEGTRIASLPASIGRLSKLKSLNLSRTPITSLPDSAGNLSQLKSLNLSHTPITSLPEWIGNLSKLEILDLSRTPIASLPEWIGKLSQLETLDLSNTPIASLPDSIGNLSKLKSLYLGFTQIDSLPESVVNLSALKLLYLNDTRITSLPGSIGNLSAIEILDLNHTRITSLPESIANLSALKFLYLNRTRITSLPESISNLSALEELDLNHTRITSLPGSIGNLSELRSLDLSDTRITILPEWIDNLSKLEILDLSITQIDSLPESIGNLGELSSLVLSYSRIRGLPWKILDLPNTCTIELTGCPLSEPVLERLRDAASLPEYDGPRLSYLIPQERLLAEKPLEEILAEIRTVANVSLPNLDHLDDNQKGNLAIWLNKLSWTADWKQEEARFALCQRAVTFLQLAHDEASFAEIFFPIIEEAVTTCGDRVALSLIDLSLAYEMSDVLARTDLNSLSQFLLKRVWPIDQLKKIAANKIPALRFFDEIEVYLGYLIRVGKEKLDLDLGVQGMLYFGCAGLTEDDISEAHAKVMTTLGNPIEQAKFLAGNGHWQKTVSTLRHDDYKQAIEQDNPSLALISLASNLIQKNNNP